MPTANGFGAQLAGMLPEHLRYDESARAVCLRVEMVLDAIAPVNMRVAGEATEANHIDPSLTANLVRSG